MRPSRPELGERAAHGLDGQTQEVADVGARHRQLEVARVLPIALVAARKGQQEAHHALGGAALSRGQHEIAGCSQLARQGFVELEAERGSLAAE